MLKFYVSVYVCYIILIIIIIIIMVIILVIIIMIIMLIMIIILIALKLQLFYSTTKASSSIISLQFFWSKLYFYELYNLWFFLLCKFRNNLFNVISVVSYILQNRSTIEGMLVSGLGNLHFTISHYADSTYCFNSSYGECFFKIH